MRAERRCESGQVTVLMVVVAAGILVLVAAVYDGGEVLAAKRRAANEAQSAARAGAQAVDVGTYRRTGEVRLDPVRAQVLANDLLHATGQTGTVDADPQRVRVTVAFEQPTALIGILGITAVHIEERAESRALSGITAAEP